MTLEEVIKHCEEVADQLEGKDGYAYTDSTCDECAKEHRQLAKWLQDYKRLIAKEETTHFEGWENPNYNPEKDKRKILLWCAKCHEPVLGLFVYCPQCGRKFNSQEVQE